MKSSFLISIVPLLAGVTQAFRSTPWFETYLREKDSNNPLVQQFRKYGADWWLKGDDTEVHLARNARPGLRGGRLESQLPVAKMLEELKLPEGLKNNPLAVAFDKQVQWYLAHMNNGNEQHLLSPASSPLPDLFSILSALEKRLTEIEGSIYGRNPARFDGRSMDGKLGTSSEHHIFDSDRSLEKRTFEELERMVDTDRASEKRIFDSDRTSEQGVFDPNKHSEKRIFDSDRPSDQRIFDSDRGAEKRVIESGRFSGKRLYHPSEKRIFDSDRAKENKIFDSDTQEHEKHIIVPRLEQRLKEIGGA